MKTRSPIFALLIVSGVLSYAQIPVNGLVLYYPFNGSAVDSSGNANQAVLYNCSFSPDRFGVSNRALSCNGTNSRVVTGDKAIINLWGGIAVSVWVKLTTVQTTGMRMVFGKSDYQTYTDYILRIKPQGYIQWQYGFYAETSSDSLSPDRWYHLYTDATAPNGTRRVFIDSKLVATNVLGASEIHGIIPNPLTVGAAYYWTSDCSEFFHGEIDDLRLYNRVLLPKEIAALAGDRPTEVRPLTTPDRPFLEQNFPNPFNPSSTIRYGLPNRAHVTLTVFNALGQRITVLQHGEQESGYHEVQFNASNFPSGAYFYRMQAGSYVETKRLFLLK